VINFHKTVIQNKCSVTLKKGTGMKPPTLNRKQVLIVMGMILSIFLPLLENTPLFRHLELKPFLFLKISFAGFFSFLLWLVIDVAQRIELLKKN